MREKLVNRRNYLLVMEHLDHLKEKHRDPKSITRYWFLLKHLLLFSMDVPFPRIHNIKPGFNAYAGNLALSAESRKAIVTHARSFLTWCKNYHHREFAQLPRIWIEDLTPVAVSGRSLVKPVTEEEILRLARLQIASNDLALQRDQAAACLIYLSGIRGGSLVSLPISAVVLDTQQPHILEYPELGVMTKNRKRSRTYLYHIPELLDVVARWDAIVRSSCRENAPWYMPVSQEWGMQYLDQDRLAGKYRAVALNHRFRILWDRLSLPHKSPHKFRHGSALYGLRRCRVMEEYHLISRNLMHQDLTVTDQLYINFEDEDRGAAIQRISSQPANSRVMVPADAPENLQRLLLNANFDTSDHAIKIFAEKLIDYMDRKLLNRESQP